MHVMIKTDLKPYFLKSVFELSFVNFVQRMFAKEPIIFAARTCVGRMEKKQTLKIKVDDMEDCYLYCHVMDNDLTVVVTADSEYPENVVKKILSEILKEFQLKYNVNDFYNEVKSKQTDLDINFQFLDKKIKEYQNPKEADKFLKLEGELKDIQNMLQKTMTDLLERGEQLDELVQKSDDLNAMSKGFYDKCKKANTKCCSLY